MAEEREMEAADERRLSEELDRLEEEVGERRRMYEALAASALRLIRVGFTMHMILFAAVFFFFPGGTRGAPGRLAVGLSSTAVACHVFLVLRLSRSSRRVFLERGPELLRRYLDPLLMVQAAFTFLGGLLLIYQVWSG